MYLVYLIHLVLKVAYLYYLQQKHLLILLLKKNLKNDQNRWRWPLNIKFALLPTVPNGYRSEL